MKATEAKLLDFLKKSAYSADVGRAFRQHVGIAFR
jgi:hypothetical protein